MLVFMAYPPPDLGSSSRQRPSTARTDVTAPITAASNTATTTTPPTTATTINMGPCQENSRALRMCDSRASTTTASIEDAPPQSVLSLSSEASSQILLDHHDDDSDHEEPIRPKRNQHKHQHNQQQQNNNNATARAVDKGKQSGGQHDSNNSKNNNNNHHHEDDQPPHRRRTFGSYFQHMEDVPRVYIEKLYENTVDGPCHVNLCEVKHIDLFTNCQQPLSFLGFGHDDDPRHAVVDHTITISTNNAAYHHHYDDDYEEDDPLPLPGAYAVSKSCEYCGSPSTSQCHPTTCRRPRLFFQKKRPPFAVADSSLWDPITDEAIATTSHAMSKPTLPRPPDENQTPNNNANNNNNNNSLIHDQEDDGPV